MTPKRTDTTYYRLWVIYAIAIAISIAYNRDYETQVLRQDIISFIICIKNKRMEPFPVKQTKRHL